MTILFGHPTGNPNSHQVALAHFERHRLEAFCVPWMPRKRELQALKMLPQWGHYADRLARRSFPPLDQAPTVQGRLGEWARMARGILGEGRFPTEGLPYEANDWLMKTMAREASRSTVTAVHAYEDCSLWSFQAARRLGRNCIYDLPIGYYPAWEQRQAELAKQYADWLPPSGLPSSRYVRPAQKIEEMKLADLVLVACTFVRGTVERFVDKPTALAPYGVDTEYWLPGPEESDDRPLRFIYAGQCSIRKGTPVLLDAWKSAGLKNATLELLGAWQLTEQVRANLPPGVSWSAPVSRERLRKRYQCADVFVFPSFFEGFGLVILEAMACGLPVITTDATAGPDILAEDCGFIFDAGDVSGLVDRLRWFSAERNRIPAMAAVARTKAASQNWERYRERVSDAVAPFC